MQSRVRLDGGGGIQSLCAGQSSSPTTTGGISLDRIPCSVNALLVCLLAHHCDHCRHWPRLSASSRKDDDDGEQRCKAPWTRGGGGRWIHQGTLTPRAWWASREQTRTNTYPLTFYNCSNNNSNNSYLICNNLWLISSFVGSFLCFSGEEEDHEFLVL